jgi:WD40 repeat protein
LAAGSASSDQTPGVWDLESGETIWLLDGHTEGVNAVAVVDATRVVSASEDQTLRVWDLESGETAAVFALDAPVGSVAVIAGGRGIVAGDSVGGLHILDLDLS